MESPIFKEPNPELLPLVQSDDLLPPISLWTRLGGFFLVATFGVAAILAAVTKYNVTVKAPAIVRPTGEIKIVQATTEGTVKSIPVAENMQIAQGQAIAILDNSRQQTQKNQLTGNIEENKRQLGQIIAQLNSLDDQLTAEFGFMNRAVAAAKADLSRNQRDYKERQITTQTEVTEVEATLRLAQQRLKSAQQQRDRYKQAAADGIISLERYEETEQAVKDQESAIQSAQAKLARAKAALNPSAAPLDIATERIAQERERGEATVANLQKEHKALQQRQIEIQNQINRDRRELQQLENEMQSSVIRASASGIILKLNLRNAGQFVRSGEPIAQIAPSNIALVIKARVAAQDIANVALNQKSQMRISAYPYPDYGVLNGKVSAIAPDVITSQTNSQGQLESSANIAPYYEVTIKPEKITLEKGDRQYPIQPGMEVTADIISKEETVLTFILRKARFLSNQ